MVATGTARVVVPLHVFAEGAGVSVTLCATMVTAVVGLIGRVYVHVLLAVRRIRETSVTSGILAGKRFFT